MKRNAAYVVPVRVLIDAATPEEAVEKVTRLLKPVEAPIGDFAIGTPVAVPDRVDKAITDGIYRDGDAFAWHDQVLEIETRVAMG